MAYVVVAYIVMACIVMAQKVPLAPFGPTHYTVYTPIPPPGTPPRVITPSFFKKNKPTGVGGRMSWALLRSRAHQIFSSAAGLPLLFFNTAVFFNAAFFFTRRRC